MPTRSVSEACFPVLANASGWHILNFGFEVGSVQSQCCRPLLEQVGKSLVRRRLQVGRAGQVGLHQLLQQIVPIAITAPTQEKISRPSMAMTAKEAGMKIIRNDELVSLRRA